MPPEPDDGQERIFYSFFHPEEQVTEMTGETSLLEQVMGEDAEEVAEILQAALGELPRLCPYCQGLCPDHTVKLRDAFMARARDLSKRLQRLTKLYAAERECGIVQPTQLIQAIYDTWQELFVLYPLAEPQESVEIVFEEGDFGPEPTP
jgi:hypothetical protein